MSTTQSETENTLINGTKRNGDVSVVHTPSKITSALPAMSTNDVPSTVVPKPGFQQFSPPPGHPMSKSMQEQQQPHNHQHPQQQQQQQSLSHLLNAVESATVMPDVSQNQQQQQQPMQYQMLPPHGLVPLGIGYGGFPLSQPQQTQTGNPHPQVPFNVPMGFPMSALSGMGAFPQRQQQSQRTANMLTTENAQPVTVSNRHPMLYHGSSDVTLSQQQMAAEYMRQQHFRAQFQHQFQQQQQQQQATQSMTGDLSDGSIDADDIKTDTLANVQSASANRSKRKYSKKKRDSYIKKQKTVDSPSGENYFNTNEDDDANTIPSRAPGVLVPPASRATRLYVLEQPTVDLGREMTACLHIMDTLLSAQLSNLAWPFRDPVNAEELGLIDYHEVITQPMDLSTVRSKILSQQYEDTGICGFLSDIRLIWANCYKYNGPTHDISKCAAKLENLVEQKIGLLPKILKDKAYGIDYDSPGTPNGRSSRRLRPTQQSLIAKAIAERKELQADADRKKRKEAEDMRQLIKQRVAAWELENAPPEAIAILRNLWEVPSVAMAVSLILRPLRIKSFNLLEWEIGLLQPHKSCLVASVILALCMHSLGCSEKLKRMGDASVPYAFWHSKLEIVISQWYSLKARYTEQLERQAASDEANAGIDPHVVAEERRARIAEQVREEAAAARQADESTIRSVEAAESATSGSAAVLKALVRAVHNTAPTGMPPSSAFVLPVTHVLKSLLNTARSEAIASVRATYLADAPIQLVTSDEVTTLIQLEPFFQIVGDTNPLADGSQYHTLPLQMRLCFLNALLQHALDLSPSLRDALLETGRDELRASSLGTDAFDNEYFYFSTFSGSDLRLYRRLSSKEIRRVQRERSSTLIKGSSKRTSRNAKNEIRSPSYMASPKTPASTSDGPPWSSRQGSRSSRRLRGGPIDPDETEQAMFIMESAIKESRLLSRSRNASNVGTPASTSSERRGRSEAESHTSEIEDDDDEQRPKKKVATKKTGKNIKSRRSTSNAKQQERRTLRSGNSPYVVDCDKELNSPRVTRLRSSHSSGTVLPKTTQAMTGWRRSSRGSGSAPIFDPLTITPKRIKKHTARSDNVDDHTESHVVEKSPPSLTEQSDGTVTPSVITEIRREAYSQYCTSIDKSLVTVENVNAKILQDNLEVPTDREKEDLTASTVESEIQQEIKSDIEPETSVKPEIQQEVKLEAVVSTPENSLATVDTPETTELPSADVKKEISLESFKLGKPRDDGFEVVCTSVTSLRDLVHQLSDSLSRKDRLLTDQLTTILAKEEEYESRIETLNYNVRKRLSDLNNEFNVSSPTLETDSPDSTSNFCDVLKKSSNIQSSRINETIEHTIDDKAEKNGDD